MYKRRNDNLDLQIVDRWDVMEGLCTGYEKVKCQRKSELGMNVDFGCMSL